MYVNRWQIEWVKNPRNKGERIFRFWVVDGGRPQGDSS